MFLYKEKYLGINWELSLGGKMWLCSVHPWSEVKSINSESAVIGSCKF